MKTIGIVAQTAAEYVGLIIWLELVKRGQIIASVVLLVGLLLEHYVVHFLLAEKRARFFEPGIISISEAIIWVVWLVIIDMPFVAPVFLFVSMFVQHSIEQSVFEGRGLGDFFNIKVFRHTLIEVFGASAWILFATGVIVISPVVSLVIGATILLIALSIEHILQSRL